MLSLLLLFEWRLFFSFILSSLSLLSSLAAVANNLNSRDALVMAAAMFFAGWPALFERRRVTTVNVVVSLLEFSRLTNGKNNQSKNKETARSLSRFVYYKEAIQCRCVSFR